VVPNGSFQTIPNLISKKHFPNLPRLTDKNVIMHLNNQCNCFLGSEVLAVVAMESIIFCSYVASCCLIEFTDVSEKHR
jgi:NADH:ubiquinone oxidoreductase subunit B-like Fe-S oxidoreductase